MFAFQIAPNAYNDSDEYIYSTETLTDLHHIQQFFNSRAKYKGYYINFSQCASPRPLYRIFFLLYCFTVLLQSPTTPLL